MVSKYGMNQLYPVAEQKHLRTPEYYAQFEDSSEMTVLYILSTVATELSP